MRVDDLPKLGEILDLAVGAGATSVTGVRFDLKDRTGAEREALQAAVEDARARANAAAAGAGLKVERIVRIEEQRATVMPPPRQMAMRSMAMAERRRATPVVRGRPRDPCDGHADRGDPLNQLVRSLLDDDALHGVVVEEADQLRRAERTRASDRSATSSGSGSGALMPLSFRRRAVTSTRLSSDPIARL